MVVVRSALGGGQAGAERMVIVVDSVGRYGLCRSGGIYDTRMGECSDGLGD